MSFESGSVGMRVFALPGNKRVPADVVERLAAGAMPAIETLNDGVIQGWVTGRHLLDRAINADTAFFGNYLRVALCQAERKVPEGLLRAECRMEELAHIKAQGVDKVSGSVRREIRKSVEARLRPTAPPVLKGIPVVFDQASDLVFTGAMSDRQTDALQIQLAQALGFALVPLSPMTMAARAGANVRDLNPFSFARGVSPEEVTNDAGMDFLMWLWFVAEARGGTIAREGASVALMIEGPLRFCGDGAVARDVRVTKGEPLLSTATAAALKAGMKLRSCKVTLAAGQAAEFTFTIDAVEMTVRGLKLRAGEKMDAVSVFQDRVDKLRTFWGLLTWLYGMFLRERKENWPAEDIFQWLEGRRVRG